MIVLIIFCSQGDNIQDAVSLTEHLDQWISVTQHLVSTIMIDNSTIECDIVIISNCYCRSIKTKQEHSCCILALGVSCMEDHHQ